MKLSKEQEEKLREEFADIEHKRWAKWQKYFFSKCQFKPQHDVGGMDDRYVYIALTKDLYERWQRQIETPYSELSEAEKESDREQVQPYVARINEALITAEKEKNEALIAQRKEIVERIERQIETIHGYGGLTDEFKSIENGAIRKILSLPQLTGKQEEKQ